MDINPPSASMDGSQVGPLVKNSEGLGSPSPAWPSAALMLGKKGILKLGKKKDLGSLMIAKLVEMTKS